MKGAQKLGFSAEFRRERNAFQLESVSGKCIGSPGGVTVTSPPSNGSTCWISGSSGSHLVPAESQRCRSSRLLPGAHLSIPSRGEHQRQGLVRGNLQLTSSKGKEKAFVGELLQKCIYPLPHPLVPLVDKLLAEVAVDLLSCDAFLRWQRGINEIGNLHQNKEKD